MTDKTSPPPPPGDSSASGDPRAARWGALVAGSPFEQLIEVDELGVVVGLGHGAEALAELGVALTDAFDGPGAGLFQEARLGVAAGDAQRFTAQIGGTEYDTVVLPTGTGGALLQLRECSDEVRHLDKELRLRTLELESARTQLRRYALEDPLTGVDSAQQLVTRLNAEFSRARRYATPLSVLFVEIADLGDLNLQHGHLVGDVVLSQCAWRLRDLLRDHDIVGRYTTHQFCLCLPHTDVAGADVLVRRVRATVVDEGYIVGPETLRVAFRTGHAQLSAEDDSVEALLARAEAAVR